MKYLLLFTLLAGSASADVTLKAAGDRVTVEIDGTHYTTLFFGPDTKKPYLHPLRTASGIVVTRGFPMEKIESETTDHPHHQGLWFTHGDVNGLDFWLNEKTDGKSGRVVLDKVGKTQNGKNAGVLEAAFRWVDAAGKPLLAENRRMVFRSGTDMRIIDVDLRLTALEQVRFGDTKEGTFAIRLHDKIAEKQGGMMTNASGGQKMKSVWGKPSPWVHYAGEVGGKQVAVTIFDHKANPGHPTHWHARDYGLFAANIFGLHDFMGDPKRDGSRKLAPKQTFRFRYRVLIHEGEMQMTAVQKLYEEYR